MAINAVDLPFREQAEFFRRKLNLPTESWIDIYREQHDWAFVVAGANRDNIVAGFREAVQQAIDGGTLEDFRKQFDNIVAKHGWSYNGGRNWRSRVIYDTNINSSYMAGRYEQLMAVRNERPYWQYLHSDAVEHPRPIHESWNDLILRWDDPWWRYHFPVNAWGCQCRVIALSEADLIRMGRTADTAPPINWVDREIGQRSPGGPISVRVPEGIDPGFEYIPGQSRLHSAVPNERSAAPLPGTSENIIPNTRASDALPAPRRVPTQQVPPAEQPPLQRKQNFLQSFGATPEQPAVFRDVVGDATVVGAEMLTALQPGTTQQLHLLAQTLQVPDEIWTAIEWHEQLQRATVRRRYIARFILPGENRPVAVVFENGKDGWAARISSVDEFAVDDMRVGVRVFQRGE